MEQRAAPLREEILAAIATARTDYEARVQRMNDTLARFSAEPVANVGSSRSAPTQTLQAADLEQMGVGALFSRADEAQAKGDKAAARAALRTLLRRFPDHPLAERAASILPTLRDN